MKTSVKTYLTILSSLLLAACSGGGGGSDDSFVGAADVSVVTQPSQIDSGDRTEVSIELSNVHDDGIALKIRVPNALVYVRASAMLLVGSEEQDLTPTVNDVSSDDDRYIVFYIPQSDFKTSGQDYNGESGTVVLQLEGVDAVTDGLIEVDPDVDDPQISNDTEFDISNPEFVAQAETSITVVSD